MTSVESAGVNQVGDAAVVKANGVVHCRDTVVKDRPAIPVSVTNPTSLQILSGFVYPLSNQIT